MKRSGFSLIEVMVAGMITGTVFLLAYAVFFSTTNLANTEIPVRNAQLRLQQALDQVSQEMKESTFQYTWTGSFTDPAFQTTTQTYVLCASARDTTSSKNPKSKNLQPDWQQIVIYAPYYRASLKRGELRRYFISPVPGSMLTNAGPTMIFTAANISVNGFLIARSGGDLVLADLDVLTVSKTTRLTLSATTSIPMPANKVAARTTYTTSVFARN